MDNQQPQGQVRIYACGGAGVNIGSQFENDRGIGLAQVAQPYPVYVDTSKANLEVEIPSAECYLLEGLDGSGGLRAENAKSIGERAKDILNKFPPMDLNIVISSASGGSGSVIAPTLASELLNQDKLVVVFLVGANDSRQYIQNSINTLKSYDGICKRRQRPVVLYYRQNGVHGTVEEIDRQIRETITTLMVLFSRQNKGLDSQDLYNWVNFHRVTSFEPQVAILDVYRNTEDGKTDIAEDLSVISVATLTDDINNSRFSKLNEFQRVGLFRQVGGGGVSLAFPLHFVTHDGYFNTVLGDLQSQIDNFNSLQAARIRKNNLLTEDDNPLDSGLVL